MGTPLNILVVEDHDLLRHTMVGLLREHGHNAEGVFCAEDVDQALMTPDIYIVDLNLPGEDGISLTSRLRQSTPHVGIVIVSARSELLDRMQGYKTGADVYLTKPFESEELLAVIESIRLRRKLQVDAHHGLSLDMKRMLVKGPVATSLLTQAEVNLLVGFSQADEQVLGHGPVAAFLKLDEGAASRATLNVRLSHLRKKLQMAGAEEPSIRAIRGHGYKLCLQLQIE